MRFARHSTTAVDTSGLGESLGRLLRPGDVVALYGKLGAGKTCLVQGIARGLGIGEDVVVTSPSFVIVGEYRGRHPFYHIDLYRLSDSLEIGALGLEEYVGGDGVAVIEWAQKARWLVGPEALKVWIQWRGGNDRTILIEVPDRRASDFAELQSDG